MGIIEDLLFDRSSWRLLRAVVNADVWLGGWRILLSPELFGQPSAGKVAAALTRADVRDAPVTVAGRRGENQTSGEASGVKRASFLRPVLVARGASFFECDSHGVSSLGVLDFGIADSRGVAGLVDDLLLDDREWCILTLVAAVRKADGTFRTMEIPVSTVTAIDCAKGLVRIARPHGQKAGELVMVK